MTALYDATVAHVRRADPPYSFAHRMYLWRTDLDDLPRPDALLALTVVLQHDGDAALTATLRGVRRPACGTSRP